MAKAANPKPKVKRDSQEGTFKLAMTFDEAMKLAANTPPPSKKKKAKKKA